MKITLVNKGKNGAKIINSTHEVLCRVKNIGFQPGGVGKGNIV
jgi:hypothetical protein